ncbi:hypothetical protein K435DRAFT_861777 [Dendrothele bispora CBS 962.96]|uniref:Uncharacterized protein n=1 Tax=Dendrothele bispora (strain CBS 962.96) TaxID=1314807 RepID=A0A4S8LUD5_DENBC|nr:hypothetical protein K435DRAFT_861777 [Dendrothele bispora CBS 962.96]
MASIKGFLDRVIHDSSPTHLHNQHRQLPAPFERVFRLHRSSSSATRYSDFPSLLCVNLLAVEEIKVLLQPLLSPPPQVFIPPALLKKKKQTTISAAAAHSDSASDGHNGTTTYKIRYMTLSVEERLKELQHQCPSKNYNYFDADKCLFVKRTEKVVHDVSISQVPKEKCSDCGHTHRELSDLDSSHNTGKDLVVRVKEIVEGVYTV